MPFRLVFGTFLIFAAGVMPGSAQTQPASRTTYAIRGTVRDDYDQHAMARVRIDLKEATGTPVSPAFTRGNGEFEFDGLPGGEYILEIAVQGYESFQEKYTIDDSARQGVLIFLRRSKTIAAASSGGIISAHELSIPQKAHDEYEKGLDLLYLKSNYKGAILQFERAISDFPNFYEAYLQEGNAYVDLEQMGPAEKAMRKSVELSSSRYPDALFRLAGLLNNTKRYPEAAPLCRQGLAIQGSSWLGNFELARALAAQQQLDEAEKDAVQARDLKPDNPAVYLLLANIHLHRKDYRTLLKDLEGYLKVAPDGPEADQARKTRDEAQAILKAQEEARSTSKSGDQTGDSSSDESQYEEQEQTLPPLPPLPPQEP
jgi:tetratricopeptide (TPR) repeat protein